jgi:hypothetical protein
MISKHLNVVKDKSRHANKKFRKNDVVNVKQSPSEAFPIPTMSDLSKLQMHNDLR